MKFYEKMSIRFVGIITALSGLGVFITTLVRTPDELGPFGITLWFLGLVVTMAGCLTMILYLLRRSKKASRDNSAVFAQSLRYGSLISVWVVALVALNSLRQLGLKDIVLVSLLVILIEFYLRRAN